jgi:hypothetical protein
MSRLVVFLTSCLMVLGMFFLRLPVACQQDSHFQHSATTCESIQCPLDCTCHFEQVLFCGDHLSQATTFNSHHKNFSLKKQDCAVTTINTLFSLNLIQTVISHRSVEPLCLANHFKPSLFRPPNTFS